MKDAISPEDRLAELGVTLPQPASPIANYAPWRAECGLVTISGQLPLIDGEPRFRGTVGETVSVDEAVEAAKLCAVNLLAQLRNACEGDLRRVRGVLRLAGFVNAAPGFQDHPKVLNGASDLMVAAFGPDGRHARTAVGVSSLPLGVPVEIEGQFLMSMPNV